LPAILVQVLARHPACALQAVTAVQLQAAADVATPPVVLNERAGSRPLAGKLREVFHAAGVEARVLSAAPGEDLRALARRAL
jgi:hypothetical protein